jgi:sirohydrochlorin ferrochelatase
MILALIDNGSLEPAAYRHLRATATALGARCGVTVHPVSWKHSDRISLADLEGAPAWTLPAFVRAMVALGQREFVFVPFFISDQGAIGSALRSDLEQLRRIGPPFDFRFTSGLSAGNTLAVVAADRVRETLAGGALDRPAVVIADHGGPSPASAQLRDTVAEQVRVLLADTVSQVAAASMDGRHPPLLAEQLRAPGFSGCDVVVASLFLSPGRHAGPGGDIDRICAQSPARCHRTELVGTHPLVLETLISALQQSLSHLLVPPSP